MQLDIHGQELWRESYTSDTPIMGLEFAVGINLDIKPGSDLNAVNPRSEGFIPVAILTTDTFNAQDVNPTRSSSAALVAEAEPLEPE